ncbi:alpha/beta hydrolase [Solimonas sp. K1W22B-7]|uniref:alpha/beta hydrolase n=1 Tax=Solimonas sp. K1W22B-7 TaxID=2303331 RepID=UPI0013C4BDDB|nr:alpha/beta hydrolase [Solimonas sp. K1W22B-7]
MRGRRDRKLLSGLLRLTLKPLFSSGTPIWLQRRALNMAHVITRVPDGVSFTDETLNGVTGECVQSAATASRTVAILYLHGGGYCVGAPRLYRAITAQLAITAGVPVHVPGYRLAPEHPWPAALNDVVAAYRALLESGVTRIVLAGDSAGGGLALAAALALREAGLTAPKALVLLSPWVKLGSWRDMQAAQEKRDPMLSRDGLRRWATAYCDRVPQSHPLCSPLLADLRGLPPTLIQGGSEELLIDDLLQLERKLHGAGVLAQLQIEPDLWHVYQLHAGVLAEADLALAKIGRFLTGLQLQGNR